MSSRRRVVAVKSRFGFEDKWCKSTDEDEEENEELVESKGQAVGLVTSSKDW